MSAKKSTYLAIGLVVVTALYGFFQARTLIHGPQLSVSFPTDGATITETLYTVTGSATNVSRVSLNGRPITTNLEGDFEETLVTPEGYHELLVEAENRLGRSTEMRITMVGAPVQTLSTTTIETKEP